MTVYKNMYRVLGVPKTASYEEIRRAFKHKALYTHPDKLPQNATEAQRQAAEAKFREIYEAFEILSDPERRKIHDTMTTIPTPSELHAQYERRKASRAEWAQAAEQRRHQRLEALREKARQRAEYVSTGQGEWGYEEMVDILVREMHKMSPEWEARKQEVLRRQAERTSATALQT
ncbi:hypothetical protein JAAARDRAFT_31013 [Jaapia argillacea MUCL 33604]|uniref:J domain-containing protein n=1 Tax=Jaapia argillacea MUCL 33604 TaxID=933084 RepID=A0A067QG17_9AGAM|nr:hypothetical protein JAAARDRAFT_31013 [Jaapia argillacea MUCL 33604]